MTPFAKQNRRLLITTFQTIEIINVSQIVFLEAYENYCKIHMESGSTYISTNSFGSVNIQLFDYGFFHCHKSFVINFCHILRFHKAGEIEMCTNKKVPLARRRKELFLHELHEWCTEECACQEAVA